MKSHTHVTVQNVSRGITEVTSISNTWRTHSARVVTFVGRNLSMLFILMNT